MSIVLNKGINKMTPQQLKNHYITWTRAMRELDFSPNAYQNWLRAGSIPLHAQLRIEDKTKGKFKADKKAENRFEKARRSRADVK